MSLKECDAMTKSQEALWVTFGGALAGTGVGVDTSWTPLHGFWIACLDAF